VMNTISVSFATVERSRSQTCEPTHVVHCLNDFEVEKVEENQLRVRGAASRKHELEILQSQTPIDDFQYDEDSLSGAFKRDVGWA